MTALIQYDGLIYVLFLDAAAAPDSSINTVENLQVSFVCDPSGGERRSVEGAGGNLRVSVSTDGEHNESMFCSVRIFVCSLMFI